MKLSTALNIGFAAHVAAAPATNLQKRDPPTPEHCVDDGKNMIPPVSESNPADPVVGLPKFDACGKLQAWNMPREICDDLELRGPLQFTETYRTGGGDFPDAYNMATWFRSFAGGSYDSKNKNGEPYSIPLWAAQYDRANFPLKCNKDTCELGDGTIEECKEDYQNSQILMILESTISLYNNIKALFSAIDSARNEIAQKIPDMYNWFGAGDIKEDPSWDKAIGVLTSAFGLFGELTTAGMGTRVATVALGGAFASALLPEAPKEQKFERASQSVSTFTSNVQIILDVINDYIDTQFVKPAPGPKGGNEINNFLADPHGFVNLISSGAYAGNSPVDVGARNQSIVASLAAPLINEMWIQAQIFVAHFRASDWTGGDWGEAHGGKNLCDESFKFFEDIQADGKICDPNTGDLKMLMHFGKTPGANWAPGVREIPGLDLLGPQFYITRKQIIDASEANQHLGWLKLPTADEMMKRYSDFASSQLLAAGNLNVWNLPYCYVQQAKSINAKMDIEEFMAISAMGCAQGKDGTGAPFPYQSEKITPCTRC